MEITVLEEKQVNRAELKDKLDDIKKEQELGFRSNKTLEYLNTIQKHKPIKHVASIKEKLSALGFARLKDKHVEKLIDLMPTDVESVKVILSAEALTLKQEEIEKVIECLK